MNANGPVEECYKKVSAFFENYNIMFSCKEKKGSNGIKKKWKRSVMQKNHKHTHTHIYIYIYIPSYRFLKYSRDIKV